MACSGVRLPCYHSPIMANCHSNVSKDHMRNMVRLWKHELASQSEIVIDGSYGSLRLLPCMHYIQVSVYGVSDMELSTVICDL